MKLINYNYGAILLPSSTWYRGKIEMSRNEWRDVQVYLFNPAVAAKIGRFMGSSDTGAARRMREDINNARKLKNGSLLLSVRVSATDAIVARFKPSNARRYKRQNYLIHVRA